MTSHPKDVSDELIEVMRTHDRVAKHFHLPVQSGNDRVLAKMNRKYTREKYLEVVKKLRAAMPDITLTTDIIVGFPGETAEEFEDTLSLVHEVGYDSIFAFIYSPRKGTPAADMDDPVSYEEKTERFARLMALHHENIVRINQGFVGKMVEVLCETPDAPDNTEFSGRSSGNKLIRFTAPKGSLLYGKFVNVKIDRAGDVQIYGEAVL